MDVLANPVINSPYVEPSRHFMLDDQGRPTGEIAESRRRSEFFVPVPKPKKGKKRTGETQLAFDLTDEKVERNDAIDQLRDDLRYWRHQGYPGVTPISRKLLEHWSDPNRENRILFAQREAAETAIYLAVVPRDVVIARVSEDLRQDVGTTLTSPTEGLHDSR
nr:hypothetical protein [Rhodoglobus vestalii]